MCEPRQDAHRSCSRPFAASSPAYEERAGETQPIPNGTAVPDKEGQLLIYGLNSSDINGVSFLLPIYTLLTPVYERTGSEPAEFVKNLFFPHTSISAQPSLSHHLPSKVISFAKSYCGCSKVHQCQLLQYNSPSKLLFCA